MDTGASAIRTATRDSAAMAVSSSSSAACLLASASLGIVNHGVMPYDANGTVRLVTDSLSRGSKP